MSRESLIIVLGIIVFFAPSLGIPENWKLYILVVSGVLLMVTGYLLRRSAYLRSIDTGEGTRKTDSYVESVEQSKKDSDKTVSEDTT